MKRKTLAQSIEIRPGFHCPKCDYKLTGACGIVNMSDGSTAPTPNPGDLTVCINCATALIFTETLGLRLPKSDYEKMRIMLDADVARAQACIRLMWKELGKPEDKDREAPQD